MKKCLNIKKYKSLTQLILEGELLFSTSNFFSVDYVIKYFRTLVLDGQVNLSEADLLYTLTLMNDEEYGGADVLILGGGDGALLFQLLSATPKPNLVTMVELDQAVMEAVANHMPSVTGGVLNNMSGAGYQTIVGDAVKYLEKCKNDGKMFDFIFGDLTDVPIDTDNDGMNINNEYFAGAFIFRQRCLGLHLPYS